MSTRNWWNVSQMALARTRARPSSRLEGTIRLSYQSGHNLAVCLRARWKRSARLHSRRRIEGNVNQVAISHLLKSLQDGQLPNDLTLHCLIIAEDFSGLREGCRLLQMEDIPSRQLKTRFTLDREQIRSTSKRTGSTQQQIRGTREIHLLCPPIQSLHMIFFFYNISFITVKL